MGNAVPLWLILCLSAACQRHSPGTATPDKGDTMQTTLSDDFNQALVAQGVQYLALESKLRDEIAPDPQKAAQSLANLVKAEPIAQLMATVLLGWVGQDKGDSIEALDYLDKIGPKLKRSAVGHPRPAGVAGRLADSYSDRVANLLALRLVKQEDWPHWRVEGVLQYLQECKKATTTSALLRFAMEAKDEEWRRDAIETVKSIGDPDLAAKLTFEKARQRTLGKPIPDEFHGL